MAWETLVPDGRSSVGVAFGYAVRLQTGGKQADERRWPTLSFVLSAAVVRAAKLQAGEWLRIDVDRKARKGRLTRLAQPSKAGRKLHVSESGRSDVVWPCSGPLAELFGSDAVGVTPLAYEVTSEGIVFDLPARGKEGS